MGDQGEDPEPRLAILAQAYDYCLTTLRLGRKFFLTPLKLPIQGVDRPSDMLEVEPVQVGAR